MWFLTYHHVVTVGKCQIFNGDHSTTYLYLRTGPALVTTFYLVI